MKKNLKLLTILAVLLTFTASAFARDNLDKWLDKYEEFIETVEVAAKNNQTSKISDVKAKQQKLIAEKDKIQEKEGNFTFHQGTRYAALNTRWGIAYGALNATKGIKKAAEKTDEFLEEKPDNSSDKKSKSKKA